MDENMNLNDETMVAKPKILIVVVAVFVVVLTIHNR